MSTSRNDRRLGITRQNNLNTLLHAQKWLSVRVAVAVALEGPGRCFDLFSILTRHHTAPPTRPCPRNSRRSGPAPCAGTTPCPRRRAAPPVRQAARCPCPRSTPPGATTTRPPSTSKSPPTRPSGSRSSPRAMGGLHRQASLPARYNRGTQRGVASPAAVVCSRCCARRLPQRTPAGHAGQQPQCHPGRARHRRRR